MTSGRKPEPKKPCKIDGCHRDASIWGMCNTHRMRIVRYEERMNKPGVSFRTARPEMERIRSPRAPLPGGDE